MSEVTIKVENLGKKYTIDHRSGEKANSIKEAISLQARSLTKRLASPLKSGGSRANREEFWALKDVSFEIEQGDVVGIVGRNGAGKSTLLKILSQITAPTTGRIELNGRVASLLEVGTGFHPELTGRENIFLNGAILGMSRAEIKKKFDEIVDFAEIEKFLDTPVKRYSSGMYVRLAFAVAAHMEPDILVVDEVLAVGDAAFQKKCLGKMGDVATREGRTVLFVSHNMNALISLCKTGLYLKNGKLVRQGPINILAAEYMKNTSISTGVFEKTEEDTNQKFSIRKVSLQKKGITTTYFLNSEDVDLQIEYIVKETIRGAQVAFEVLTDMDECLFSSTNQDWSGLKETINPGKYTAICSFPIDYFRPGNYSVKVSSSIPGIEMLDQIEENLAFEVQAQASPLLKLGQNRRGYILPILQWRISNADPNEEPHKKNKNSPQNLQETR